MSMVGKYVGFSNVSKVFHDLEAAKVGENPRSLTHFLSHTVVILSSDSPKINNEKVGY